MSNESLLISIGELRMIAEGLRIGFIRAYRERTGVSLVEAKNVMDYVGEAAGFMEEKSCAVCGGTGKTKRWREGC